MAAALKIWRIYSIDPFPIKPYHHASSHVEGLPDHILAHATRRAARSNLFFNFSLVDMFLNTGTLRNPYDIHHQN